MAVRDLQSDLQFALGLADLADEMSMDAFHAGSVRHSIKSDGTPTIHVEVAIEDEVRNALTRYRLLDGFVGEETGQSGNPSACWIIDPIDGTKDFIKGEAAWATQIAFRLNGDLTLGVTSAPALGSRWWGAVGHGSWMSSNHSGRRPLKIVSTDRKERLRWSCHPALDALGTDWRRIASGLRAIGDYVAPDPHAVLMVIEGQIEVALQLEGAAWDYAAFAAIVSASGGRFSYLDSSIEIRGVRPALFTNGIAHDGALHALAEGRTGCHLKGTMSNPELY
jgi:histidinol-phosphatase